MLLDDTITAISTAKGEGAIGIVRLSGNKSFEIIKKIFRKKSGELNFSKNSINYGHLLYGGKIVDEVLVNIIKGPNTYTKEDIVEINCHGGHLITNNVLELVLKSGARLAEPGEFTKRAFLNGRIDLSQAEAVIDIINAKTEKGAQIALGNLRGDLQKKIGKLKQELLDVASFVNVVIDYPEEGIEEPLPANLREKLEDVMVKAKDLTSTYDTGKKIKNGIRTIILGKPNVGKSSVLNALLREERSIVTHVAGTTRDIIEEVINIKGIPLLLIDTAGIRKTDDFIENIGVNRSKEKLKNADLILFVIDGSEDITDEDCKIYEEIKEKKVVGIFNKTDIKKEVDLSCFKEIKKWIYISAKEFYGIKEMEKDLYDFILENKIEDLSNEFIITNIRHKLALDKVIKGIENIFITLDAAMPLDLISIDLKECLDSFSEITGEITGEDILENIFKNFCVGK